MSASGFYAAQQRPPPHGPADDARPATSAVAHAENRRTYGPPRLQHALRAAGVRIGDRRCVADASGGLGARAPPLRVTTDSAHQAPVAPNHLARAFAVAAQSVWAGDITALWTAEGWLYLAVLLDLASRRVVGWAADASMTTASARRVAPGAARRALGRGVLHHSDRGGQYASARYQAVLRHTASGRA